MSYRTEKDLLGEKKIAKDAYWGIHTARARENFTVSRWRMLPLFIRSYAMVKKAAAQANQELGFLTEDCGQAIAQAIARAVEVWNLRRLEHACTFPARASLLSRRAHHSLFLSVLSPCFAARWRACQAARTRRR